MAGTTISDNDGPGDFATGACHGTAVARAQVADAAAPPGHTRFGKMLDLEACEIDDGTIKKLFELLRRRAELGALNPGRRVVPAGLEVVNLETSRTPAGFTYLGQFIDHDVTFDPTPALAMAVDPNELPNFRSARLDLDSLYGSGPADQPYLYDQDFTRARGAKLLVDRCVPHSDHEPYDDLPRNRQRRALIGDPRNDEHVIISQLHLVFIHFHNAVVDHLLDKVGVPAAQVFEGARQMVRWHYQWIVAHEFLRAIVGEPMRTSVLVEGVDGARPTIHHEHFQWEGDPFIPVEFSGAAYRFGHSMVRGSYAINLEHADDDLLPLFPDLRGQRRLPPNLVIEWKRFFHTTEGHDPQDARRIDAFIAEPLFKLPDGLEPLPLRNLRRGQKLGLPSGQDAARALGAPVLRDDQLETFFDVTLPRSARAAILHATPLWFYILCEARAGGPEGHHLGPVGGRIVAEVLLGLLAADPDSYVNVSPAWKPELARRDDDHALPPRPPDFTMSDLIWWAQERTGSNPPPPPP